MAAFRGHKASLSRYISSPYPFSYHVFLSFRGEETRKNFTDHLYTTLVNAGLHTFRDDPQLERGENIKEELQNAIRQSRCSVIVFSKDYTSSRWCLDELVMILHLKSTSDHVVLPVFYDVNPSQLRKEAENISNVQENQSLEKLNGWQAAVREVADLAGMVLADGHESKFILNVIEVIQDKLGRVPLSDVQEVLQEKLLSVNPVLDDAEGKQLKFQTTVKPWLHMLKEAVYHAEDLLQEIKTEVLRQKIEHEYGSSTSEVRELISPSPAFDSALMYSRVEQVLERLDFVMEQRRDVLGLEASADYKVSQIIRPSTSLVEDSGVCGRNDEKETLTKWLLSDDESGKMMSVIPIVGMGGIGKTTLAQFLYNDVIVKQHFDLQAWVCVSKEFDVLRISQHIYESITKISCQSTSLDLLQLNLQETLWGKRFLFILDDIWNRNYNQLEFLMRPFYSGAHGSKIIVTTRDENVGRMMGSLEAHRLRPMSEEDGWSLFKKHAFKNSVGGVQSHLEEIGRQIVCKCNGLPLAIKSLGGLLCSKLLKEEWETILISDMWDLSQDESEILPSLWLSYMNLPPQLKRCFAYCSIFPKNYAFKTSQLVYLWKAEDLLQPKENRTADEIGQEYFNDLLARSFFQLSSSGDKLQYFTMHDLIFDMATFVSGEFCFRWEESDDSGLPKNLSKTRHLSCLRRIVSDESLALQQAIYLRTFLPLRRLKGACELLPRLQCLRMLKLSGFFMKELPDSINNLKLLRHLDLSNNAIQKLPDTVCTLYNLQALLLSRCHYLTELPANLGRLINLSHLDNEGTKLKKMPPDMGNLQDLQMLPEFVLDSETAGDNLPEVKKLQNLRGTLCISGLVHSSGLGAYILRDKNFLKELVLTWGRRRYSMWEEREVLEKLQPHLNLERLTIKGYGGQVFPGWSGYYFFSALVYLQLVNCVNCVSLPPLGQLPSLTELRIKGLHGVLSIGSEFYYGDSNTTTCVNTPFRSLRYLTIMDMIRCKEWSLVGGDDIVTFPMLTKLHIGGCRNLMSSLPAKMHSLFPSLQSLRIQNCGEMDCFPKGGFPTNLKSLEIMHCKKLNAKGMQVLTQGCLGTLGSLERLKLDFDSDEKVEDRFSEDEEEEKEKCLPVLPSTLVYLEIHRLKCETIDGAKWFGHLNSLQELMIRDFPALRSFRCLPQSTLKTLKIAECPALLCFPDCGLPSSIKTLDIYGCNALRFFPESGLPPALEILKIWKCPVLQCLPECGLPSSLLKLDIWNCPLLEKRCQRGTGEDWPKIAHKGDIYFNGRYIRGGAAVLSSDLF